MKLPMRIAALVALVICVLAVRSAIENSDGTTPATSATGAPLDPPPINLSLPVFTNEGAPLCLSRDGLSDLLEHMRAGVREPWLRYGCVPAPDGGKVAILRTEGIIDR